MKFYLTHKKKLEKGNDRDKFLNHIQVIKKISNVKYYNTTSEDIDKLAEYVTRSLNFIL